jgi:hypothetical protein
MGTRLVDEILAALDEQTMVVPGTQAAETILPKLADTLKETLQQRKAVAEEVERALDEHPLSRVGDLDARHRFLRLQPGS